MILENSNDQVMVLAAFDHSLGRRTYIVGLAVDWLITHWPQLHTDTRKIITTSTRRALESGRAGDQCDISDWMRLLQHAESHQ